MTVKQLTAPQLQERLRQDDPPLLLDVREPVEYNYARIDGSLSMPLNQVPARLQELDPEQEIVVICHHGVRSQQAAQFLFGSGFANIANLIGGIEAWSCQCDPFVARY
jgi:rhodanese-related sulfurtransferase